MAEPAKKKTGEMSPRRYGIFMAAALALLFIASNTLVSTLLRGARLDLTESHLYSLSDGTKKIVGDLAEPIDVTLYYSADASAKYPGLRAYSARVRELLQSYSAQSHGQIRLREVNPVRFTEAEDEAAAAGIQPQMLERNAEPIYFGIAGANAVDERVAISFLSPNDEAYLEYQITRLISELDSPKQTKIALVTSLPFDPMAAGAPGQPLFFSELTRAVRVDVLPRGFPAIPDDVEELVIIQPWQLNETELYAIDQFIMRKGRAFIAVDPAAVSWMQGQSPLAPQMVEPSATLDPLLNAWGLGVSHDVVLDNERALEVETQNEAGQALTAPQPMYVSVPADQISRDDLITAGLQRAIYFGAAGAINWAPTDGVIVTPLARSTKSTMRFPAAQALQGARPQDVLAGFQPSGRVETFAAHVSGSLKSAFGPVKPPALAAINTRPHLAKSARPVEIVLVSDVDFLNDSFYVSEQSHTPFVDNGAFALNAIDMLAGSDALVSLRSRAPSLRSLEKVDAIRRAAQERLVASQQKLQASLDETETHLAALEAKGRGSGFFTGNLGAELTPEEREEMEKFRAQSARVRSDLRGVEADYRRDLDRMEMILALINVWAAPLLVAGVGLFLFWRRARRREKGA